MRKIIFLIAAIIICQDSFGQKSDTLKNGVIRTYFSNRVLKSKARYKNGLKSGKYTKYFNSQTESRKIREKALYKNGYLYEFERFYWDGSLEKKVVILKNTDSKEKVPILIRMEKYGNKWLSNRLVESQIYKCYPLGILKKNGTYLKYDQDVLMTVQGQYQNGLREGRWKYYLNGEETHSIDYIGDEKKYEYKLDGLDSIKYVYSDTGYVKKSIYYRNGKKNGLTTTYNAGGFKRVEKSYKNDLLKSTKEYYPNQKLKLETPFTNNLVNGVEKKYYESGKLEWEYNYLDGELNGLCKIYYESGKLEGEYNYVDGSLNGLYITYYESGKLEREDNYVDGERNGPSKDYYESGKLEREKNYVDGELNGPSKSYYESGKLEWEYYNADDKLNGLGKNYYESGKLYREINYVDGQQNGVSKYYNESGKLEGEDNYVDGERNGPSKDYYESGKLKEEHNYVDNKKNGLSKTYYESGNLQWEVNHKDGKQNGLTKYYYESGKLHYQENYVDGEEFGQAEYYYESGQLERKGDYIYGERDGMWLQYNESGIKNIMGEFKEGQLNGTFKSYYPSGKIYSHSTFRDGDIFGVKKTFYEKSIGIKSLSIHLDDPYKKSGLQDTAQWYKDYGNLKYTFDSQGGLSGIIFQDNQTTIGGEEFQLVYSIIPIGSNSIPLGRLDMNIAKNYFSSVVSSGIEGIYVYERDYYNEYEDDNSQYELMILKNWNNLNPIIDKNENYTAYLISGSCADCGKASIGDVKAEINETQNDNEWYVNWIYPGSEKVSRKFFLKKSSYSSALEAQGFKLKKIYPFDGSNRKKWPHKYEYQTFLKSLD